MAEFYTYRRLMEAIRYYNASNAMTYQWDPFAIAKRSGLTLSLDAAETMLGRSKSLPHTLFCSLNLTDILKGQPSTTIGGHWTSRDGFWGGGTYAKTLRTMPKRGITYQSGVYLGFDMVDVYSDGNACQPPW